MMKRQYVWFGVMLLVCLVVLVLQQDNGKASKQRSSMIDQNRITGEADAISVATQLTGFDKLKGVVITAQRVTVENDNTPFLAKQLIGISAWQVKFENVSLSLKSADQGFQDPYIRTFVVLIREDTGQLWSVKSFFDKEDPDMRAEPSATVAEDQMRAEKEIYDSLPTQNPLINFLDALDVVLSKGSASPFLAKEFHAVYVMESDMGSKLRPVWAITLRGIPPLPVSYPDIPVWQRNHMRHLINAQTGELLFATNSPQPL